MIQDVFNIIIAVFSILAALFFMLEKYQTSESSRVREYIKRIWIKTKVEKVYHLPIKGMAVYLELNNLPIHIYFLFKFLNSSKFNTENLNAIVRIPINILMFLFLTSSLLSQLFLFVVVLLVLIIFLSHLDVFALDVYKHLPLPHLFRFLCEYPLYLLTVGYFCLYLIGIPLQKLAVFRRKSMTTPNIIPHSELIKKSKNRRKFFASLALSPIPIFLVLVYLYYLIAICDFSIQNSLQFIQSLQLLNYSSLVKVVLMLTFILTSLIITFLAIIPGLLRVTAFPIFMKFFLFLYLRFQNALNYVLDEVKEGKKVAISLISGISTVTIFLFGTFLTIFSFSLGISYFDVEYSHLSYKLILTNLIFDLITVFTTYLIISIAVINHRNIWLILTLFTLDIFLSGVYGVFAIYLGTFGHDNISLQACYELLIGQNLNTHQNNVSLYFFVMHTTFTPTFLYLVIIFLLLLINIILRYTKYFFIPENNLNRPYGLTRTFFILLIAFVGLMKAVSAYLSTA